MSTDTNQLLRVLGSSAGSLRPVAPGASRAPGAKGWTPIEHADFARLLEQAQAGSLSTGLPVTVEKDAGVSLSEEELAQLSVAADKAEAAGIRSALVMLDGKSVLLDVHTRSVKGAADLSSGLLSGVDGVINLTTTPGSTTSPAGAGIAPLPSPAPSGNALIRLLASGNR
jgi:hypothetical protein